jgi:hypothetical protein
MQPALYTMSFTTGGLFYQESVAVAEVYSRDHDWVAAKEYVQGHNLLQARTQSTGARIWREVSMRLKQLTADEMELLVNGSRHEQQTLLWVAVCKRYRFIRDFAIEVMREKILRMDFTLNQQDYEIFFNAKADWHDELGRLSASTQQKLKQVLFRMLYESEILSRNNEIQLAMLSERLAGVLVKDNREILLLLPVTDAMITEWM